MTLSECARQLHRSLEPAAPPFDKLGWGPQDAYRSGVEEVIALCESRRHARLLASGLRSHPV